MSPSSRQLQSFATRPPETFLLGSVKLSLTGDASLIDRFLLILGDCGVAYDGSSGVGCHADSDGTVTFTYPGDRLDLAGIVDGLRTGDHPGIDIVRGIEGDAVAFDTRQEWRGFAANCAINVAMALQPEVAFFHAASVNVGGSGILISGSKGRGKSTLSLTLGLRGHQLLGDEMAAVRLAGRTLLPLRRAASLRQGVRSAQMDARLSDVPTFDEVYPDGSPRTRVRISDLFPGTEPDPVALRGIVFLRSFAREVTAVRFTPTLADTTLLQPLGGQWNGAARRFRLLQLLTTTPCFHLDAADPDATAASIEQLLEAL